METVYLNDLVKLFDGVSEIFQQKKDELCELDARMGDGDLGLTLSKGFGALSKEISELVKTEKSISNLLIKGGLKMTGIVPSTMGTLMASGLIAGGKKLEGAESIGPVELADFLDGFVDGIQKRGKACAGDRTIVDSLLPAAQQAEIAAGAGDSTLKIVILAAEAGAIEGVENTKNMTPKFGKTAVFASKAVGTVDQGAVAGLYFIKGLKEVIING